MSRGRETEPPTIIHSPANPTLKLIRSLHQRKRRLAEGAFVVEGRRAIYDALAAGGTPLVVVVREDIASDEVVRVQELAGTAPIRIVPRPLFDAVAETESPQGILAVFAMPELPVPDVTKPLILVLDQMRDPGNMGTILRSAAGAGVTAVVLSPACVDPFNDKAVRAGVGAHFRVPILSLTDDLRLRLGQRCPHRIVADAAAAMTYDQMDWTGPVALVIGSEAVGVSETMNDFATDRVRIPLAAGVESLNAAVAASVILFEAARQRRVDA